MPSWTFTKKTGVPAGTIHLAIGGDEFIFDDTTNATYTTTNQSIASELSSHPWITLSGLVQTVPPTPVVQPVMQVDGVLSTLGPNNTYIPVLTTITTVATASAAYTVASGDYFKTLNATGGAFAVTLPSAAGTGRRLAWRAINTNANAVTITPNGTDTIDGQPNTTVGPIGSNATWLALELIDAALGAWRSL